MFSNDLILLLLVAAGAFYAGFQVGRFKTLSEQRSSPRTGPDAQDQPLPGPELDGPIAHSAPPRPRGTPPPANAGNTASGSAPTGSSLPRRSTTPPPAAAGLLDKGSGKTTR